MYDIEAHIRKSIHATGKKPKYLIVNKKDLADYPKDLKIEPIADCHWQVKLLIPSPINLR